MYVDRLSTNHEPSRRLGNYPTLISDPSNSPARPVPLSTSLAFSHLTSSSCLFWLFCVCRPLLPFTLAIQSFTLHFTPMHTQPDHWSCLDDPQLLITLHSEGGLP